MNDRPTVFLRVLAAAPDDKARALLAAVEGDSEGQSPRPRLNRR